MATHVDALAHVAPGQAHHRHVLSPPQLHPSIYVIPALKYLQCLRRQLVSLCSLQEGRLAIALTMQVFGIESVLKGKSSNAGLTRALGKATQDAREWRSHLIKCDYDQLRRSIPAGRTGPAASSGLQLALVRDENHRPHPSPSGP